VQHAAPQQVVLPEQLPPCWVQGGATHLPNSQNDLSPSHLVPQPPQLWGSLAKLTHASPQHERPATHATVQGPPPEELPLELPPPELLPELPPELVEPPPELLLPPLLLEPAPLLLLPAPLLDPAPLLLPAPLLEPAPELPP
jgi:hypothetical protein